MSDIEMACTRLSRALENTSAQKRYTTMMNPKYVHPGWVDYQSKSSRGGMNYGKSKTYRR